MTAQAWPRTVSVSPERLPSWLDGFTERHGAPEVEVSPEHVSLLCPDGAAARIVLVWGALEPSDHPLDAVVAAFTLPRRVGALIVRRRAHAVGVFDGASLLTGRHGSHYVQGRTKAGGWSQQRYSRRRENQAERSFDAAAADVAAVLLPERDRLEALVTGGDRTAVETVLGHPGLERLADPALRRGFGHFGVPDPNAHLLAGFGATFRKVPIDLNHLA